MPTQNPRINVVLDNALYKNIRLLAEKDSVSMSAKVRDLIKEALEIQEDMSLTAFAEERENTLGGKGALSHEEVWK